MLCRLPLRATRCKSAAEPNSVLPIVTVLRYDDVGLFCNRLNDKSNQIVTEKKYDFIDLNTFSEMPN